jgi:hypothetical protein
MVLIEKLKAWNSLCYHMALYIIAININNVTNGQTHYAFVEPSHFCFACTVFIVSFLFNLVWFLLLYCTLDYCLISTCLVCHTFSVP